VLFLLGKPCFDDDEEDSSQQLRRNLRDTSLRFQGRNSLGAADNSSPSADDSSPSAAATAQEEVADNSN
jgi:hypothetical protein